MCTWHSAFLSFFLPSFFIFIALFPFISKLPLRSLLISGTLQNERDQHFMCVVIFFSLLVWLLFDFWHCFHLPTLCSCFQVCPNSSHLFLSAVSSFPISLLYRRRLSLPILNSAFSVRLTVSEEKTWKDHDETLLSENKSLGVDRVISLTMFFFFFFQFYWSFSVAEKPSKSWK